jgi:aminoglycoside 3-N-acetyltransferase
MITKTEIKDSFRSIGAKRGDILVLQSSYKGCGEIENGPEGLIEAILDLLGPEGTLIMPAYNFTEWTKNHYFDVLETPSEVGIITEIFRRRNDVGRTVHPIHSLSVWGKHKAYFESIDYCNSFGEDSIFKYLIDYNALYCTIGLGSKMPFLPCHYTEDTMNVSYRRFKDFGGVYVDKNRKATLRVYSFRVRVNQKNPVFGGHCHLLEKKMVKTSIKNNVVFCYSRARDYNQNFIDYIKEFPDLFTL